MKKSSVVRQLFRLARKLRGKPSRRFNKDRQVIIEHESIKIVIQPIEPGAYHQEAIVYLDDKVIGSLQVHGRIVAPYNQPMDLNRYWKMPKGLVDLLRSKGYKCPYLYMKE